MKVSEATQAWVDWRNRRTLQRILISWGVSLVAPALVLTVAALTGTLLLLAWGDDGHTISVKLGNPDGENTPLSVTSLADPMLSFLTQQAAQSAEVDQLPAPIAIPKAEAKPIKAAPAQSLTKPTAKPAADPPAQAATTIVKGAEHGNTTQAVFEGNLRGIRENLHPLISLFMPLPKALDAGLLDHLQPDALNSADDFRKMLLALYEPSGTQLRLKGQPPVVGRDYYWVVLLRAGFDANKADYKTERKLNPITLSFKLSAATGGDIPKLTDIKLEKSSGDAEIDSIVKTVFEQYRYSNPLGATVAGKFTYEF